MTTPARTRRPVRSFRVARNGSIGLLAALTGLALLGLVGLSVDGARAMFVRERLISALDAGALAGGRVMSAATTQNGMPQWQNDALAYYNLNFPANYLGATAAAAPTVTLSADGTQLTMSQTVSLPLLFGGFMGYSAPVSISHASTAFAGRVEVALVLDGGIYSQKETTAGSGIISLKVVQQDATALVNSLTSMGNNSVRIALVPFSKVVNVGAQYINASWLDSTASYIYQPNYYNAYTSPYVNFQDIFVDQTGANHQMDRWTLFNNIKISGQNSPWAGCVEMRPAVYNTSTGQTTNYDVNDLPVTSDPASKFVPWFAPSESDVTHSVTTNNGATTSALSPYSNIYLQDLAADNSLSIDPDLGGAGSPNYPVYSKYNRIQQGDYKKYQTPVTNVPDWKQVTNGGSAFPTRSAKYEVIGPNAGCIVYGYNADNVLSAVPQIFPAVTRLTSDASALTAALGNLIAVPNSSNLTLGLFWGWEMISPNSVFADGQASYSNPDYKKAVIILSNGCNRNYGTVFEMYDYLMYSSITSVPPCGHFRGNAEYSDLMKYKDSSGVMSGRVNMLNYNLTMYQAEGYSWQNRYAFTNPSGSHFGELDTAVASDNMLNTVCSNMKAEGIIIYAILTGADYNHDTYMQSCATDANHYYNMPNTSQLNAVFQQIAGQLTTPRLIMK